MSSPRRISNIAARRSSTTICSCSARSSAVRAASVPHSSASHARGRHARRRDDNRRLPPRRTAEAPAARVGREFRAAAEGRLGGHDSHKASTMSPVALFLQADIVVKIVMVGLLLASIWTWTIIVSQWLRMRRVGRDNDRFERDFWKAEDIDSFYEARGKGELPSREGARRRHRRMAPLDHRPQRSTARGRAPGSRSPWPRRSARRPTGSRRGSTSSPRWARSRPSSACSAPSGGSCAASPTSPARRTPRSPWSRRASPRPCSRPRSACSRRSRR